MFVPGYRHTIARMKRAGGLPISTNGHEDLKVGLAQVTRHRGAGSPERENQPSTNLARGPHEVDILKGSVLALICDGLVSLEVLEALLGQVRSDGSHVLLSNERDEDGIAEEELEIDAVRSLVLGG